MQAILAKRVNQGDFKMPLKVSSEHPSSVDPILSIFTASNLCSMTFKGLAAVKTQASESSYRHKRTWTNSSWVSLNAQ